MSPQRHLDDQLLIECTSESTARFAPSAVSGLVDPELLVPQARLLPQGSHEKEWDPVLPLSVLGQKFDDDLDADEDEDESDWNEDEEDDEDWDEDEEDDEDWDEDEEDDDEDDWGDEDEDDEDWDEDEEDDDEDDFEGTADKNCL